MDLDDRLDVIAEQERRILYLHLWEGLSVEEVAARVGATPPTVRMTVIAGMTRMLGGVESPPPGPTPPARTARPVSDRPSP